MRCTWRNEDGTCCGRRAVARHYDWMHRRQRWAHALCGRHDRLAARSLRFEGYERYAA